MNLSDNATHLIIVLVLDICGTLLILLAHDFIPATDVFAGMLTVTGTVLGYRLGAGQATAAAAMVQRNASSLRDFPGAAQTSPDESSKEPVSLGK